MKAVIAGGSWNKSAPTTTSKLSCCSCRVWGGLGGLGLGGGSGGRVVAGFMGRRAEVNLVGPRHEPSRKNKEIQGDMK